MPLWQLLALLSARFTDSAAEVLEVVADRTVIEQIRDLAA